MHKYNKIYELKQLCLQQAQMIRETTAEIKKLQKEGTYAGQLQSAKVMYKLMYRRSHIAHCLLRGKLYDNIEQPKREQNKLTANDWKQIEQIRSEYYEIDENVCVGA